MPCRLCTPVANRPVRVDFTPTDWWDRDSHQAVGMTRCRGCGEDWLHFTVELFEDHWGFWSPLTVQDRERIQEARETMRDGPGRMPLGGAIELLYQVARSIIRSHTVVCEFPTRVV